MKLVNSFILEKDGGGLGDYIRGSLACYQIANKYNIPFEMDIANHPIKDFIVGHNKQLYPNVLNLFSKSESDIKNLIENHIYEDKTLVICSNAVPQEYISDKCKKFVRNNLIPIDELKNELPRRRYHAIHIRSGDMIGFSKNDDNVINIFNLIKNDIEKIIKITNRKRLIVISDSLYLKKLLNDKYRIIDYMSTIPAHTKRTSENISFKDTLIDFFTLQYSEQIYQFTNTNHYWGSGFSDSANWLRDVPIIKFKFNNNL